MHAAAIAAELGIERILCPRAGGVLSALGLCASERRRDTARTVMLERRGAERRADRRGGRRADRRPAGEGLAGRRARGRLRDALRRPGLRAAGPRAARSRPRRPGRALRAAHEERYGHRDPDGEVVLVDIRLAMVVARARSRGPAPPPAAAARGGLATGPLRRRVGRDAGPPRRARAPAPQAEGPVVFELPEATLVLPPGWSRRGRRAGTIVARRHPRGRRRASPDERLDPITLQVLVGGLRAACDEMGAALIRSAYSANIKERHDCSTALFDAAGELVMQAEHIPVHLGSMPDAVAAVLGEEQRPGERLDPQRPLPRRHPPARHHPDLPGLRARRADSASPPAAPTTPTSAARRRAGCRPTRGRSRTRGW